MKIAIIEPVGGHGGMNYYDFGLARGLASAGVKVRLYTCDQTEGSPAEFELFRWFRGVYGRGSKYMRGIRYLMGLFRSLVSARMWGAGVVHLHFFQAGPLEFAAVLGARILAMSVVITVHDVEAFHAAASSSVLERWSYRLADRLVVHNTTSKSELCRVMRVPVEKIHVIPHGNYLDYIGEPPGVIEARRLLDLPATAPLILFFGQIKEVKGLDLLLKAFQRVRDCVPEARLVVAGKVWKADFSRYQAIIDDNGLGASVRLDIRYVPDAEVDAFYMAADVVALPYRKIYQSGVLLMAMSYGKTVVASDLAAMREIVEDGRNGYLFRSGDSEDLSVKLLQALQNPHAREAVGMQAKVDMAERFGWERIGVLTADCYRAIA